uniref:Uncharacterized protein n=1 Tax=Panagrolaimus sp. ES5 TaxID=591445 RepID=A0AC34GY51_9BILA
MSNEIPESKSILRQLLLSNDESDSLESSQRKRKIKDDNEAPEKRRNVDIFNNERSAVVSKEGLNGQLIITINNNQRCDRFPHELVRRLHLDANEEQFPPEYFYFGPPREMNGSGFANNSSQPKEDDLPV